MLKPISKYFFKNDNLDEFESQLSKIVEKMYCYKTSEEIYDEAKNAISVIKTFNPNITMKNVKMKIEEEQARNCVKIECKNMAVQNLKNEIHKIGNAAYDLIKKITSVRLK